MNVRRTQRRVEEYGEVVVRVEDPSPELFEEMIEVERASWKTEAIAECLARLVEDDSLRRSLAGASPEPRRGRGVGDRW